MESEQSCAAPSLQQWISCSRGFLCLGIARELPLKVAFWLFFCPVINWLVAGLDYLILKNNGAFTICILYKELKDLSELLQGSACIAEVLGRISSNESEIWEAESCLEQRWREVTTDLARYNCSVCLHSIFSKPLYSCFSQTPTGAGCGASFISIS